MARILFGFVSAGFIGASIVALIDGNHDFGVHAAAIAAVMIFRLRVATDSDRTRV